MLKKFPSDEINNTKIVLFFLSRASTHQSFVLIFYSYMHKSTRFFSLELCVGFSIFMVFFSKMHRPFDFKMP